MPHTDDSEITVNVGLIARDAFEGGDLLLGGVRGQPDDAERRDHAGFRCSGVPPGPAAPRRRQGLGGEEGPHLLVPLDERRAVARLPMLLDEPARWGRGARLRLRGRVELVDNAVAALCSILSSPRHRRAGVPFE